MISTSARRPRYPALTYRVITRAVRLFLYVYFPRLKVMGAENVPRRGSAIIVSNHLDYLDPVVLLAVTPRRATFLAMRKLFDWPVVGWFARMLGVLPVRDDSVPVEMARAALQALAAENAIVVFPEGELSANASLQRASSGAAMLAYRSGAPVVPVGITGTERIRWPWIFALPLFGPKITVRFGAPVHFERAGPANSAKLRTATDEIMHAVAALLPERYRGVYGERPAKADQATA